VAYPLTTFITHLQTLMRQLAESKDSLQFSNQLCEQLEGKVEELEASNEQLVRQCRERQAVLDQKNTNLVEAEEDLASARDECEHVRADLDRLRSRGAGRGDAGEEGMERGGEDRCDGGWGAVHTTGQQVSEEVTRLREEVDMLTLRVQSSEFQKRRLKRELLNALGENTTLVKNLEKAEGEIGELQLRLEELSDESNRVVPVTPHSAGHVILVSPTDTSFPQNGASDGSNAGRSEVAETTTNAQSLFSELDNQFSSLQQSYGDLLHKCTCSAGLGHRVQQGVGDGAEPPSNGEGRQSRTGGAFKELFDEMFATLKQTAEVADRLIEKRAASVIS
jgi:peptidoglycan hydrolase CwlO-like protein